MVASMEPSFPSLQKTSTLVNFFEDMKQIAVDKGIKVEKNAESYNLFDDANEV